MLSVSLHSTLLPCKNGPRAIIIAQSKCFSANNCLSIKVQIRPVATSIFWMPLAVMVNGILS